MNLCSRIFVSSLIAVLAWIRKCYSLEEKHVGGSQIDIHMLNFTDLSRRRSRRAVVGKVGPALENIITTNHTQSVPGQDYAVTGSATSMPNGLIDSGAARFLYVDLQSRKTFVTDNRLTPRPKSSLRFVCISDTHTVEEELEIPPGDVLIHTGDITYNNEDPLGNAGSVGPFNVWIGKQPFAEKILIAGNHDRILSDMGHDAAQKTLTSCTYLQDEACNVQGLQIYGSPISYPYSLAASKNSAFSCPRELDERENISHGNERALEGVSIDKRITSIAEGIDVLLTHGPPFKQLDYIGRGHIGSHHLAKRVGEVRPKVHVFGHIHGKHLDRRVHFSPDNVVYINAASVENYVKPFGEIYVPIVFDMPLPGAAQACKDDNL